MAQADVSARILDALESAAGEEGLDIVDVEVAGPAGHPVVRVRIDTLDDTPIDMNEVVARTPWVSQVVEDLDPFPGAWELEVSSPGLDRPLRKAADFERFRGEQVEVATVEKIDGRNRTSGELMGLRDGSVVLKVDGGEWAAPLEKVKSARIKPDFAKIFAQAKDAEADGELLAPDGEDE